MPDKTSLNPTPDSTPKPAIDLPPLSLYIHIPWCVKKCPYCDFNSHEAHHTGLPEYQYIQALLDDLDQQLDWVQGRPLASIFIGGGTPSLFSGEAMETILQEVEDRIPFADDIEVTMEANPGTFEAERFAHFFKAGVNRLSVGVQSFQDAHLTALGRIHNSQNAIRAIKEAKLAGFENFNIDLMHGLPKQTIKEALADLKQAISLSPTHISWYQLTIEPNTEFYSRPPKLPEEDTLWDIQEAGQALLAEHGYHQYEVSAYGQAGKESKHNLNYWQFGDYLGIGAGAHGKVTLPKQATILRTQQTRLPNDYMNRIGHKGKQTRVALDQLPFEFMLNVLRLKNGAEPDLFCQRTGLPISSIMPVWQTWQSKGMMRTDRIAATDQGFLFLNDLMDSFLQT